MEELHPLANTPMYVVYPFLAPFKSCLRCCPYMDEEIRAEDLEMVKLRNEGEEKSSVQIGGRKVLKR